MTPALAPPAHPGAVSRPRLTAMLDRGSDVTVVRGAPGYGKTTLVTAWLRERAAAVTAIHLTLDRGMTGACIEQRLTDVVPMEQMLHAGAGTQQRMPTGLERLAALATARPSTRVVLILDDAHWCRDAEFLERLYEVARSCPNLQVIACSRGHHPLERLAQDVTTIAPHELAFTEQEIDQLGAARGLALTPGQREELLCELGGWPAATRLTLESTTPGMPQLPLARADVYLREVDLTEGGIDPESFAMLLKFSIPERLTHRMLVELSPEHDAIDVIARVEETGLLRRNYLADDVELTIPAMVRTALREAFARTAPGAARAMHAEAARWYERTPGPDHVLHAMRHAAAGEDWELMVRVWTQNANHLMLGNPAALAGALAAVPQAVREAHPSLEVARQVSLAPTSTDPRSGGQLDVSAVLWAYLRGSVQLASGQGLEQVSLHDQVFIGTGCLIAQRFDQDLAGARATGRRLEETIRARLMAGEEADEQMGWFHLQDGTTFLLKGRLEEALDRCRQSWRARRSTSSQTAANAASHAALIHALRGDHRIAASWVHDHDTLNDLSTLSASPVRTGALLATALQHLDDLDDDRARAVLDDIAQLAIDHELWPLIAYVEAQHGMHLRGLAETLCALDETLAAHGSGGPFGDMLLARTRADLLLAQGRWRDVRGLLTDWSEEPVLAVAMARLQLIEHDLQGARRTCAHALDSSAAGPRTRLELTLLAFVAARRLGSDQEAAHCARTAAEYLSRYRIRRPFTTIPRDDLEVLRTAMGPQASSHLGTMPGQARSIFPESRAQVRLTPREVAIVEVLRTTTSRQQIADTLFVSKNTIRTQLATLYRKLEVTSREDALAKLEQDGVIQG